MCQLTSFLVKAARPIAELSHFAAVSGAKRPRLIRSQGLNPPQIRLLHPIPKLIRQLLRGPGSGVPGLHPRRQVVAVAGEVGAVGQFAVRQLRHPGGVGGEHDGGVQKRGGAVAPFQGLVQPAGHHRLLKVRVQHQAGATLPG